MIVIASKSERRAGVTTTVARASAASSGKRHVRPWGLSRPFMIGSSDDGSSSSRIALITPVPVTVKVFSYRRASMFSVANSRQARTKALPAERNIISPPTHCPRHSSSSAFGALANSRSRGSPAW